MNSLASRYAKGIANAVGGIVATGAVMGFDIPWLSDPANAAALTGLLSFIFVVFGPANRA